MKERFLIVAVRSPDGCFGRFSEAANRAALDAGTVDSSDPYSWIEASYEIQLRRWREATHICSFTPSAHYVFLQNIFVGIPNAAWDDNADPLGLEREGGGEWHGYGTYYDDYPREFVCDSFTIDTMKHLGLRKPRADQRAPSALEYYHDAIWQHAEEAAREIGANGGFWCKALDVFTFRQREHAATRPSSADRNAIRELWS